jgi:hypothetical protein
MFEGMDLFGPLPEQFQNRLKTVGMFWRLFERPRVLPISVQAVWKSLERLKAFATLALFVFGRAQGLGKQKKWRAEAHQHSTYKAFGLNSAGCFQEFRTNSKQCKSVFLNCMGFPAERFNHELSTHVWEQIQTRTHGFAADHGALAGAGCQICSARCRNAMRMQPVGSNLNACIPILGCGIAVGC